MSEEVEIIETVVKDEAPGSVENLMDTSAGDDTKENIELKHNETATSTPGTPKNSSILNKSSAAKSTEKMDKNLKLQIKLENERKRKEEKHDQTEKEKREQEKKEREEKKLKREEEARKKKQEEELTKLKKKEEKERLAQEKAERERKKIELQNARNEEKRKREEEKEREKRQREEERLKKEEEKRQKEEERRQKEEERRQQEEKKKQKEEEKKRLEEEKLKEEEEKKRKEEKIKSHFVSYFIKKDPLSSANEKDDGKSSRLPAKESVTAAVSGRRLDVLAMSNEERDAFMMNLEEAILHPDYQFKSTYMATIRQKRRQLRKLSEKFGKKISASETKFPGENSNSTDIVDLSSNQTKYKVKFLMFDPKVYRRPPYYGTWRKNSKIVGPRNPFAKDEKFFNYEIDSDDEWEDEPDDAESVDNSGDEEEDAPEDDEDDGFFVPHGHLSDEELDEDDRAVDPETRRAREKVNNELYEQERKKSSKAIIARSYLIPKYWERQSWSSDDPRMRIKEDEIKFMNKYRMVLLASFPVNILSDSVVKEEKAAAKAAKALNPGETTPSSSKSKSKSKQAQQLLQVNASPAATPAPNVPASPNVQAPATNCQPILKFISKKSKKDICLQSITPMMAVSSEPSTGSSLPPSEAKIESAVVQTPPVMKPTISAVVQDANHGNTSEKRALSSEKREGAVKRLKLDDSHRVTSVANAIPQTNIMSLFKKAANKRVGVDEEGVERMDTSDETKKPPTEAAAVKKDNTNDKENLNSSELITLE